MDAGMTLEDAQRLVDEEMLVQEQRVLELKMRRKFYARACRLPSEVLLEVFVLLVVPFNIEEWHAITHVCRTWRFVALGTPFLWTASPPHNREYTLCMLKRSQMAGLNISMDG